MLEKLKLWGFIIKTKEESKINPNAESIYEKNKAIGFAAGFFIMLLIVLEPDEGTNFLMGNFKGSKQYIMKLCEAYPFTIL